MKQPTHYQTLDVAQNADAETIRAAYRKRARQLHPDKNPDDPTAEDRFKQLGMAYDTLKDEAKRAEYDSQQRLQAHARSARPAQGARDSGRHDTFTGFGFPPREARPQGEHDDLGDLFQHMRTGTSSAQGRTRVQRGQDVTSQANLTFAQMLSGIELTVPVTKQVDCGTCLGSGAAPGSIPVTCRTCHGSGMLSRNEGLFALTEACGVCLGAGVVVEHPCRVCAGAGHVGKTYTYHVKVPAGIKDKATVRLRGKGGIGMGGAPNGDLLVKVRVAENAGVKRNGDDFLIDLPVDIVDAALGAQVRIDLPAGGSIQAKVPPGSAEGKMLRMRNHGAPTKTGGRGDLLARVRLVVPTQLNDVQRASLKAYQQARQNS